ncbi:MAG: tRNA (adenosine(37)-N6)-threonylcarbamoyltransferase complex ATPase subunit type 1 TsaE [Planctomycetes bacterium]|nr:tRNA (adenosine(37)-N6)-threonylcarbamoyltransferase complex ATPase subunit type 1 TsaE [Planctomycetota bacterium]
MGADRPGGIAWEARSSSPETTEALGERLGRALVPGALVALIGELGSGKTTLVRGLARGLEVRAAVTSPTFTRMRALPGRLALFHFDAWRGGAPELFEQGAEFLAGDGVAVVEWAERVAEYLPRPRLELSLRHLGPDERGLTTRLVPPPEHAGPGARALALALGAALEQARTTPGLDVPLR